MIFRIYHETRAGHVHMRLFAGEHEGALGLCGVLCMRAKEFAAFLAMHPGDFDPEDDHVEFLPEPERELDRLNLVRKLSGAP
jgi:hypothetical protein